MPANQQDFLVKHGMTVRSTATISTIDSFLTTATNAPARAALNLSFISGDILDPRINFTRASGASYVGKDGFIEYVANNVPRFDYDPATPGAIKGLLIEEARTNIYRWSTSVTTSTWSFTNTRVQENAIQAPDGTYTAPIVSNTPNINSSFGPNADNYSTSTYYTKSIYAKYITGSPLFYFQAILSDNSYIVSSYNIQSGIVNSQSYGNSTGTTYISNAGNGWYRCTQTFQTKSTGTAVIGDSFFIGGYGSTSQATSFGVWGGQSEAGPFATSLIATGSASATRQSDDARISGQNFNSFWTEKNQNEGTVYSEYAVQAVGSSVVGIGSPGVWGFTDSTQPVYNGMGLRLNFNTQFGDQIQLTGRAYRAAVVNLCGGQEQTAPYYIVKDKVYNTVSAWDQNYLYNYVSNVLTTVTNTTLGGFTGLSSLQLGSQSSGGGGNLRLCGWLRRLQFYPNRLSVIQMQVLNSQTSFTATSLADVVPRVSRTANTSNFVVQQGIVVQRNLEVPDVDKYYVTTQTRPTQQPTLNLNFLSGTLDPRISFSRASQASYVGADGYIKYAGNNVPRFQHSSTSTGTCLGLLIEEQRVNYMTYSSNFIGAGSWAQNLSPALTTGSYRAPDGTMNATTIATAGQVGCGFYKFPASLSSGTTYTFSLYAKNISAASSVNLGADFGPTTGLTTFNLITGAIVTKGAGVVNNSITAHRDGWYRLTTTFVATQPNPSYVIYSAAAVPMSFAIWGAQVEAGFFPTSYIPTNVSTVTRVNDSPIMIGQNFNSWYNPTQGTYFSEGEFSPNFNNFASVITTRDSPGYNYITMYQYIGQAGGTLRYGIGLQIGDPNAFGPTNTGTFFRQAITYRSGNYFSTYNTATSASITDTRLPVGIDRMYIGGNQNGDGGFNSTLRRLVYYPVQLTTATMQTLTSSTYI